MLIHIKIVALAPNHEITFLEFAASLKISSIPWNFSIKLHMCSLRCHEWPTEKKYFEIPIKADFEKKLLIFFAF